MSSMVSVPVKRVREGFEDLPLPEYATIGSAGFDLRAAVADPITLGPRQRMAIPTGIAIALPRGYECQIRPRSGLSIKHGISMINAPGTIDEDYRGEIAVLLINHGDEPFVIERGMKIAQGVVARYERVEWTESESLEDTDRGAGGFGSTGV